MRFKLDEVEAWKRNPITEAYLHALSGMVLEADECVRLAVVGDRLHEAKMVAGQARGLQDAVLAVDDLIEGEEDGHESSSAG